MVRQRRSSPSPSASNAGRSLIVLPLSTGQRPTSSRFGPTIVMGPAAGQGVCFEAAGGEVVRTDASRSVRQAGLGQPALSSTRTLGCARRRQVSIVERRRERRQSREAVAMTAASSPSRPSGLRTGRRRTNERVVRRSSRPGRPQFNPLISHVIGAEDANSLRRNGPSRRQACREVHGRDRSPSCCRAPRGSTIALLARPPRTVAIRAPSHPGSQCADPRRPTADPQRPSPTAAPPSVPTQARACRGSLYSDRGA